ncbi:transposable element Tcb2 transposase [Trichonephila clavipes]|uniref:Transposable element Tcb2 transposase n=1 Tax=Trichonephila clavipes TaxID=2585209 RepID=A0A8X6VZ14_TRICX|nr:transposable element Tcb2 transposase [Trichonephila clavipes]
MSLDSDYLTPNEGYEYGVRLTKPLILHARLELYKAMMAQSCSIHLCCSVIRTVIEFSQQDNCISPQPVTRWVTGWLDEHSSYFTVINCPPRSSDLNPIEHLCDVLEQGVKIHRTAPTNLIETWTSVANIWPVISVQRFPKLFESMRHRVADVIKARGGPTHY